jgi:general secretion pathway protein D
MVTEVFFPDSWGEPTLIDNGATDPKESEVGYVSSMPEFGEATELGVKLTVTPTVDPDKYTITLDMIPVVQAQVDWTDYSYIQATSGGTVKNTVRMVIIEARTVTTQVTIYDGETVVMGGIMRDSILTMEDKWPIIGDLPLVGRFFRSRAKTAIKENLLIFTTPRLVNPNGSPLRQREVRGKPPFRM